MANVTVEAVSGKVAEPKIHSFYVDLLIRLWKEKPLGTFGLIVTLLLVFTGIFANQIAPYPMDEMHLGSTLQGPSAQYPLGTDEYGRDLLSRIIFGARISMVVGLCGASIATLISVTIGLLSGFWGGWFDLVMQRIVDGWMSFPALFLMLSAMSIFGTGLTQVILVIGVTYGFGGSRIVRSAVIAVKENAYIQAATAIGCSTWRMLFVHVLPNVMAPIIIIFSHRLGAMILIEATMSFLGFGIPPPTPSWGAMLSQAGRKYMLMNPHIVIWPGVALSLVVYAINLLGDGVRDILDPKLRGGVGRYGGVKVKKLLQ